jgi:sodium-dependent dicarboxylate transporter 2/3/5
MRARAGEDRAAGVFGATPPNASVYSSGLLPITRMLKAGLVFDIIGAVLCVVGVTVMANLVGLA